MFFEILRDYPFKFINKVYKAYLARAEYVSLIDCAEAE
jgi:hypothetical protein